MIISFSSSQSLSIVHYQQLPDLCSTARAMVAQQSTAMLTKSLAFSEMSSHSGLTNLYLPSIMFLSMTSCFLCQNGGKPASLMESRERVPTDMWAGSGQVCYSQCSHYTLYIISHSTAHSCGRQVLMSVPEWDDKLVWEWLRDLVSIATAVPPLLLLYCIDQEAAGSGLY